MRLNRRAPPSPVRASNSTARRSPTGLADASLPWIRCSPSFAGACSPPNPRSGDRIIGITRMRAGRVGREYFFTRGQIHAIDNESCRTRPAARIDRVLAVALLTDGHIGRNRDYRSVFRNRGARPRSRRRHRRLAAISSPRRRRSEPRRLSARLQFPAHAGHLRTQPRVPRSRPSRRARPHAIPSSQAGPRSCRRRL